MKGTQRFIDLVGKFNLKDRYPELMTLARKRSDESIGVAAIRMLLGKNAAKQIKGSLASDDAEVEKSTIVALGRSSDNSASGYLEAFIGDRKNELELRREAVRSMGKIRSGAEKLLTQVESRKLGNEFMQVAAATLMQSPHGHIREKAAKPLSDGTYSRRSKTAADPRTR